MRRFVSVWLPDLAIERRALASPRRAPDEAALTPHALVTSGSRGLVLSAVDTAARRLGLAPGLVLADARAAVPGLVTHTAEPAADARYLEDLAIWAGRYGPDRDSEGNDGLWIDVTGVAHLYGGERLLAADLACRLARAGLTARLAIADTREGAFALARFSATAARPVLIAPAGMLAKHLAPLPVAALALAPDTLTLLARLGLGRIGLLYDLPRPALARRFRDALGRRKTAASLGERASAAVLDRLDAALGRVPAPRRPLVEPTVHCVRLPFAEPLISADGIASVLDELARLLAEGLAADGRGARAVRLALWRVDGTVARAEIRTSRPTRDPTHIVMLMTGRLEALDLGLGIDVAMLEAVHTEPLAPLQRAIANTGGVVPGVPGLAPLVDRLVNRLGNDRVLRLIPASSHIPERAETRVPALDTSLRPIRVPAIASRRPPPRPAFLLAPPEPIAVVAEVPDGPPVRFVWRRVAHVVARAEGPERVAAEWWRAISTRPPARSGSAATLQNAMETDEPPPRPFTRTRDYYRLEDAGGGRYWVFRDGLYGAESEHAPPAWYMHGLFA
ncbi:MAG: DNA polymerase Y family protein [Hyphomicrobiaceae bacterium]